MSNMIDITANEAFENTFKKEGIDGVRSLLWDKSQKIGAIVRNVIGGNFQNCLISLESDDIITADMIKSYTDDMESEFTGAIKDLLVLHSMAKKYMVEVTKFIEEDAGK